MIPNSFAPFADVASYLALPPAHTSAPLAAALVENLGVRRLAEPPQVSVLDVRTHHDLEFTQLSWNVGYGPATHAWFVHPSGVDPAALPGVLALHAHGGVRSVAAEVLLEDGESSSRALQIRQAHYEGLAPVNDLAAQGFAVLVHDAFSWGSRRLTLSSQPADDDATRVHPDGSYQRRAPTNAEAYDEEMKAFEPRLASWASLLGSSLAGMVVGEDLVALDVLASLSGGQLGSFGLSGGGARTVYLSAIDPRLAAVTVCCAMTTWSSMVPHHVTRHSTLNIPPTLARLAEMPEIACPPGGPTALLAQFGESDPLFPLEGMQAADEWMRRNREVDGAPYLGRHYQAGHVMSQAMQHDAWTFFHEHLGSAQN